MEGQKTIADLFTQEMANNTLDFFGMFCQKVVTYQVMKRIDVDLEQTV